MAIKRCPYCRSIIDEKDQYCNNCGTQLLFPEDEFIEEDAPGDKVIDLVDEPLGTEVHEGLELEEPEPLPVTKPSSSFVFPESLTAELPEKPKARKAKKAEEEKAPEEPAAPAEAAAPVQPEVKAPAVTEPPPSPPPAARTAAEMQFEEAFSAKPPAPKVPPKPAAPSATRSELFDSLGKTPLGASSEEIEDIARIMSSLEKGGKEPAAPEPPKEPRQTGSGPMPFLEREIEGLRKETRHSAPAAEKKEAGEELKKTAAEVPPWTAGLRLEPADEDKLDLPGEEAAKPAAVPVEPSSGLDDFFSSIGEPASAPAKEAPLSEERAPDSRAWADISDRGDVTLDSLADRLGRERRETIRPKARRRAVGGSKLKAKVYDVFFIVLCWAAAVWLATKILSAPITALFEVALLPLLLFLVTLAVAYFFLFLYFLGETLGDRLSSS